MSAEDRTRRSPHGVEFVRVPPILPAGREYVEIRLRGETVGSVDVRVCAECLIGVVTYIRVAEPHRRRGLATAVLRAVLADGTGYRWSTSPIENTAEARGLWGSVAAVGWPGVIGEAEECGHMREADQRTP